MAVFGGALADRIGFRRALSTAYFILACAYFLVGSIGAPWLAPARAVMPLGLLAGVILFLPALGVALVKPAVVGTTARASRENVRSLGYSIYYTMVNIGSTAGPFLAGWLHARMPPQAVFAIAAASVAAMCVVVLVFYREPRRPAAAASLAQSARDLLTVVRNGRFVLFLLIFSGFWIVFWQQYLILPIYLHDYVDPNANTALILITDPLVVITCTVALNALTVRLSAFRAIVLGTLISSLGWIALAVHPSVISAVLSLAIVALGEITLSPRYYEYVSRLAPPEQQGTYMGFAFLPIGIGSLAGGWLGGALVHALGESAHRPALIWVALTGLGLLTTLLLWFYERTSQTYSLQ